MPATSGSVWYRWTIRGTEPRFAPTSLLIVALMLLHPGPSDVPAAWAGRRPTVRNVLEQADARRRSATTVPADSLAWSVSGELHAHPPRSERDRIELLDLLVRCARPATAAGCRVARRVGASCRRSPCRRRSRADARAVLVRRWSRVRALRPAGLGTRSLRPLDRRAARPSRAHRGGGGTARADVATMYLAAARSRDMRRAASEAIATWTRAPGADSMILATALVPRGRTYAEAGKFDSARADLELARQVMRRRLGPDHGDLIYMWRNLAALRGLSDDPPGRHWRSRRRSESPRSRGHPVTPSSCSSTDKQPPLRCGRKLSKRAGMGVWRSRQPTGASGA